MADCSGVRTTGHWKGHRCGSPGLHIFDGKWWCANHFPINDSIEQIADLKHQLAEAHAAIKDIAEIVGDPACIRDGHIQRICEEVLREAGKK